MGVTLSSFGLGLPSARTRTALLYALLVFSVVGFVLLAADASVVEVIKKASGFKAGGDALGIGKFTAIIDKLVKPVQLVAIPLAILILVYGAIRLMAGSARGGLVIASSIGGLIIALSAGAIVA